MSRSTSGLCLSSATPASSPATATDDGVSLPSGGGTGSGSGAGAADVGGSGSGRLVEMLDSKVCKEQIQRVPSLLRVMSLCLLKMISLVGRGKKGAHLMYGSTLPRRGWSLRTMGRHMFRSGLIASGQDASTRADVRVIMEQLDFGPI